MIGLTPAESDLTKACNRCKKRLTLDQYYVIDKDYLTQDGRRRRMSICSDCHNSRTNMDAGNTKKRGSTELERAKKRAKNRLAKVFPEVFDVLLQEELQKEGYSLSDFRRNRPREKEAI